MKYSFCFGCLLAAITMKPAQAHHSFAMFEQEEKVWLSGTVIDYRFAQPHVTMKLEVTADDGSTTVWILETDNPRSWEEGSGRGHEYHPSDFVQVEAPLIASGWANRQGLPSMLISSLYNEEGVEFQIRRAISEQKSLPDKDDEAYLESLLEALNE